MKYVVLTLIMASLLLIQKENQDSTTPTIDVLLDLNGKRAFEKRISKITINGKTLSFKEYKNLGEEIFTKGFVNKSPVTGAKSKHVSKYIDYTCIKCHNNVREDQVLTVQSPDNRFKDFKNNSKVKLVQGTTLWGAVNRTSFYNGHYKKYHSLLLPKPEISNKKQVDCEKTKDKCKKINPLSLAESIQICSYYCSDGIGYLEDWELNSVLAYLWTLELSIDDLSLKKGERKKIIEILTNRHKYSEEKIKEQENKIKNAYLQKSSATPRDKVKVNRVNRWQGENMKSNPNFKPSAQFGKLLYDKTCLHCHFEGSSVSDDIDEDLYYDDEEFHKMLQLGKKGTKKKPYMPEYTLERLSKEQVLHIKEYLKQL